MNHRLIIQSLNNAQHALRFHPGYDVSFYASTADFENFDGTSIGLSAA
jgi:hypothetical protein